MFLHTHWLFVCVLWKSPFESSGTIVWGFLLLSSLYILDINSISDTDFANIFSYLVGCLSMLLMVSFVMQKLNNLMYSHLFTFAFVAFELYTFKYVICYMLVITQ